MKPLACSLVSCCVRNSSTSCKRAASLTSCWIVTATENEMDSGSAALVKVPACKKGQQHDRGCRTSRARYRRRGKPTPHDRGADRNGVGFALVHMATLPAAVLFPLRRRNSKSTNSGAAHRYSRPHRIAAVESCSLAQAATEPRRAQGNLLPSLGDLAGRRDNRVGWKGRKIQIRGLECSATLPSQHSDYRE